MEKASSVLRTLQFLEKMAPRAAIPMTPTHLCEIWCFLAVLVSGRTLRPEAIVYSGRRRFQLTQLSDCQPLFPLIQLVSVTQIFSICHYSATWSRRSTVIFAILPSSCASTSIWALSVSISSRTSPVEKDSPVRLDISTVSGVDL